MLPEDLALFPLWMDHQQHVSKHVPLLSQQIHRTHVRVQMFLTQHNSIVPECHEKNKLVYWWTLWKTFLIFRCTWLKNNAKCACSTASSTSASSHTIKGDLPPSSRVTGLRLLLAASSRTIFPVSVEPVKASCNRVKQKQRLMSTQPHTFLSF